MIQNFSKEFNVDSKDFEHKKYFHPEPISIFDCYRAVTPFRVGNLYESMRTGSFGPTEKIINNNVFNGLNRTLDDGRNNDKGFYKHI